LYTAQKKQPVTMRRRCGR